MGKHFTILLLFLKINFCVFAQAHFAGYDQKTRTARIDSLEKKLPALKDFKRIDCLNSLSESYLSFNTINNDTARAYAEKALKEAEKINYIAGQAMAYRNLGQVECLQITDLPASERYFSKSLALFITTGTEQQVAWAWGALGYSKWVLSKFSEAMDAFEKAEQLFKKTGDTNNLVATYNYMSNTERERGHYAKSLEYALKHKDLTGEEDDFNLSLLYGSVGDAETAMEYHLKVTEGSSHGLFIYLGMGELYALKKQYDSALHYYRLFSDFAKIAGAGPLIKLHKGLGKLFLIRNQYDSALVHLNYALNMSKKAHDENQVMIVLSILGETYNKKWKYYKAIGYARQLLQIATETSARQHLRDAHFQLYQVYDHLQKQDSAYRHLQQYIVIKDSIDGDLSAQKMAFYKTKLERERAQSIINLLNEEKKFQKQQLELTRQQKKFLFIGIFTLLLLGVILFRNILLKRKAEKNLRELAENELKIQKLESERKQAGLQQQATELEMQALRAQMNPHFIFNCLNAINGYILINESETAANYLTKFSRLIRMVLNNSQNKFISLDEELETLGLYLHMESLRFKNSFHYEIKCDDTIDALSIFMPPMLLQPFIENAIWHGLMNKAGNGELLIGLHFENTILHCTITDNGVGRKKAALLKSKSVEKNKSMGLEITKNRIALLNQEMDEHCFFEINDLEDEWGNATGTSVSLKIKT